MWQCLFRYWWHCLPRRCCGDGGMSEVCWALVGVPFYGQVKSLGHNENTFFCRQMSVTVSDLGCCQFLSRRREFPQQDIKQRRLTFPDLLQFVELSFASYQPHQRLWPYSGQTLRLRLRCLLKAVGLPTVRVGDAKPLDLGSLRAGGATWALSMTEDAELIRRRGRWISAKTMEIYIQELSAALFLTTLDPQVRKNILMLASLFPVLLQKSQSFCNFKDFAKRLEILFTTLEMEESKEDMG